MMHANAYQRAARQVAIGDQGTAGPQDHTMLESHPPIQAAFTGGWISGACRVGAHPGRVGGSIVPGFVVERTSDLHPDDWSALIKNCRERPGDGSCTHFLCGRTEQQGLLQFVSILRNSNHAGPQLNTITVGVAFHCAGNKLQNIDGIWYFVENDVIHGASIPDNEVVPDPEYPNRGRHLLSPYQEIVCDYLNRALLSAMSPR